MTGEAGFDLAVVGGGVVGAVAAYRARELHREIVILLLDRGAFGAGATALSAGLATPLCRSPGLREISRRSAERLRRMEAGLPDLPVRRLPLLFVVSEARLPELERALTGVGSLRRAGVPSGLPGRLRLGLEDRVMSGAEAVHGDAPAVTRAIVERLRRLPAVACWEGSCVHRLEAGGGEVILHLGDGRAVRSRRAILAPGPWVLSSPARGAAISASVRIKKIVALHVHRMPRTDSPVVYFYDHQAFLLPLPGEGRWLFSFPSTEWDCSPDPGSLEIRPEDREQALQLLDRYLPDLVGLCHDGRVFCDAYAPHRVPVVRPIPGVPGAVLAGAGSGSGFRLAPGLAEEALAAVGLGRCVSATPAAGNLRGRPG